MHHISSHTESRRFIWDVTVFHLGKTPVTLAGIIDFAIIILLGFVFRSLIHRALRSRVQSQSSPQTRHLMGLLSTLASNLVLGLAVIIALDNLGVRLSFLGGALGVLGIGFGIGLQTLAGNMIGLIVILLEKSIQVDDLIEVDGVLGTVVEIKARSTTIMSRDNIAIIIPNSHLIANKVINWSHRDRKTRMHLKVGIGMDAARLDHAVSLLKEIASAHPEVLRDPPPDVWFSEFGASSFNLEVIYWIEDGTRRHNVLSDLNFAIARRFAQEKIELPYPHTVVLIPEKAADASSDLAVGAKTDA